MTKQSSLVGVGVLCFLAGLLASGNLPYLNAQEVKKPRWSHGVELSVRKAGQADFGKDTSKIGIEVYKDENNNNLIYVSETGSIAVVPAPAGK